MDKCSEECSVGTQRSVNESHSLFHASSAQMNLLVWFAFEDFIKIKRIQSILKSERIKTQFDAELKCNQFKLWLCMHLVRYRCVTIIIISLHLLALSFSRFRTCPFNRSIPNDTLFLNLFGCVNVFASMTNQIKVPKPYYAQVIGFQFTTQ